MYYRLTDDTALRSWTDIGFACIRKGSRRAYPLTERQAAAFLQCDGLHDIDADATVMLSVLKKLIEPCEKGRLPSEWSSYRKYENPCFPMMNIMLTGKCNFNCLHCFNAADNTALMTEWSFDDVCSLLDEARDCGVMGFTITGGEPMMHDRFLDIIREIYKRDMTVFAVNTNGWFITKEILDELKAISCTPVFKISFDGIGTHDWMRRREGAERYALDSMRLCLENGFRVLSNTQVNRRNLHTIMPTVKLLDSIGVQEMRIIRTSEAPRWLDNASDACLSMEEYYSSMLECAAEYAHSGMEMDLEIWQYIGLRPRERCYYLKPVRFAAGEYRESGNCCNCTHSMTAITSDGEILPCNQMSGYFLRHGMSFGNVRHTPLAELLNNNEYLRISNMTAGDLSGSGGKCTSCPYFQVCGGGCRALGLLGAGDKADFSHEDVFKCYFFENGWYQKVTRALSGWKNLSEISISGLNQKEA